MATPVPDPAAIERRAGDPDTFLDRLDTIDYEMEILPGREPTETERAAIVDFFDGSEVVSTTIRFTLPLGWVVVEVETAPADAELTTRCRAIAHLTDDSLKFVDGFSCWNPDMRVWPEAGASATFSYGCGPAVDLVGLVAFGKRDFATEVFLPPDAPGVILTLASGETILLRPVDDEVIFAGPIVNEMEIFYANGTLDRITTSDCR